MIGSQILSINQDFSQSLASKNIQEARRLLQSGVIHSATHQDFIAAVCLGDLEIINALLAFPEIQAEVAANDNEVLRKAASEGHLAVVNCLLKFSAVIDAISSDDNGALRCAACSGHLAVVNRLLEFPAVRDAIATNDNGALRWAAEHGHLAVVNRLLEFPAVVAAIAAMDNYALRWAAEYGHLAVVNRLLEFPAVEVAITARNNYALRLAADHGHLEVVNRLLEFPAVVAEITADNNEALIEAAGSGHLEVVNRLLEFPAVIAAVTTDNNGAFRRALHNGRQEVIARLRQIPAVVAYEVAHADLLIAGIAAIAQDNESSIRDLSSAEMEELTVLKKRYAPFFQEQGLENILSGLRKYLIAKYNENPAQYQGQKLPLEYNSKLDKEANKEYYKNPYHTAYRYLFCKPNPWMAPNAIWVNRSAQGLWANISEPTKENIAYLWLAASDVEAPLPKGYTRDDMQNRFVDLLVDAGRGHNWDKKRSKTIFKDKKPVEIEEAYDDGEGDKPSCSLGVTRRTVAQFLLLLQPEVKPLNVEMIYLQFKEGLVTQNSQKNGLFDKMMALDTRKLEGLKSALRSFVLNAMKMEGLSADEQGLLQELTIDANALKSFMEACQQDFGERFTAKTHVKWQGENFDSYEKLVQHFAQNVLTIFYRELAKKCEDIAPKKPATPTAPALIILPESAAAPLLFRKVKKSEAKKTRINRRTEVELLAPFFSATRRSERLAEKALSKRRRLGDIIKIKFQF